MAALDRLIHVTIEDKKGKPLSGADIEFWVSGKKVAGVRSTQGRAEFQMTGPRVPVTVVASYKKRKSQTSILGPKQDTWVFQFKEYMSLKKKLTIWGSALVLGTAGVATHLPDVYDAANASCKFATGSECHTLLEGSPAQPVPVGTPKTK